VVFSDATLIELSTYLPHNLVEMKKITGFGEIKLQKYGKEFLKTVAFYCQEHRLHSRIGDMKPRKQRKVSKEKTTDTKLNSLELYKQGLSVQEIAEKRSLSPQTIEGHLAHFILEGSIEVTEIVPKSKLPSIIQAIKIQGDSALGPIKQALGEEVSYGEIKAVINYMKKIGM
jgi:ATP-dependent DNA helicase RecQ